MNKIIYTTAEKRHTITYKEKVKIINLQGRSIRTIKFEGKFENLERLDLSNNGYLEHVDVDLLETFPKLRELSMACSHSNLGCSCKQKLKEVTKFEVFGLNWVSVTIAPFSGGYC